MAFAQEYISITLFEYLNIVKGRSALKNREQTGIKTSHRFWFFLSYVSLEMVCMIKCLQDRLLREGNRMNIKRLVKHFLKNTSSEKEAMDYCYSHGFTSGKRFHYNSGFPIDSNWPWLISVGDDVTLATGVKLLAHDASTARAGVHTKIGIVKIGNNVFIGANSIVLCNTRIGDNVIVGAGSVVTRDIPSNSVYAGNPAKYVCSFDEFKERHMKARENAPIFDTHPWNEWPEASEEERAEMRKKLENGCGYL